MDENKDKNPHHSGEHLQQYSVQLRIEALDDYYHGMTIAQVCRKYSISNHRCVGRWLREFGNEKYDDAMSTWRRKEKHL
jgi:transposase-like protein